MKLYLYVFSLISLFFSVQSYAEETFKLEDCTKQNINACTDFADNLYQQEDDEQAIKYYRLLCDLDVGHGCRRVGLIHEHIFDTEPQLVKEMYFKSCALGDMIGCSNVGLLFDDKEEYNKAREYYEKACSANQRTGCNNLAVHYEYGNEYDYGVEKDFKKAAKLYKKACKLELAKACENTGNIYYFDLKNYKESLKWFKQGCTLNYGESCFSVGVQYYYGRGVKKDISTANEFYTKSCELYNADACTNIGRAYMHYNDETDPNTKKNYKKGVELLTYACENGDSLGCAGLSYAYINGLGVEKNHNTALEIAVYGCDEAYDTSHDNCFNAAWIYEKGTAVKHDLTLAKKYYKKACDEKDEGACHNLTLLK